MLDSGGMQDALQRQADQIAMDVERSMDEVLDEAPPRVTDAPLEGAQHVDDETLAYVRLCVKKSEICFGTSVVPVPFLT